MYERSTREYEADIWQDGIFFANKPAVHVTFLLYTRSTSQ